MSLVEINKAWVNLVSSRSKSDVSTSLLHHYGSTELLNLLLQNETIWATYAKHSNDSTEYKHGIDMFINEIRKFRFSFSSKQKDVIEELLSFLEKESLDPKIKPYIFCISEQEDLLSQWRGYTDKGNGISIGFDTNLFDLDELRILKKVIYDQNEQERLVVETIAEFNALTWKELELTGSIEASRGRDLFFKLLQCIFILSASFKHESFAEEKEWRVIMFPEKTDEIKMRTSGAKSILYLEWKIQSSYIKNLIFGPTCMKETKVYVKTIVEPYGIAIKDSRIPFQG